MSTEQALASIDVPALRRAVDGEHHAVRDQVRELLSQPAFDRSGVADLDRDAYRDQVLEWTRAIAETGATMRGYPEEVGGQHDVAGFIAGFETFAFGDLSLLVKIGVQFGLWGGAIRSSATPSSRRRTCHGSARWSCPGASR